MFGGGKGRAWEGEGERREGSLWGREGRCGSVWKTAKRGNGVVSALRLVSVGVARLSIGTGLVQVHAVARQFFRLMESSWQY